MPQTHGPLFPLPERRRNHAPEVFGSDITSYSSLYTRRDDGPGPEIILVETPRAGDVLMPHYHASDQFQLVVEGDGTLGKHALRPGSLHYTNAWTGYGPIVAGARGLAYYVFRPQFDPLGYGQYLHDPRKRERLRQVAARRRSLMADAPWAEAPWAGDEAARRALRAALRRRLFAVDEGADDGGTIAEAVLLGPDMDVVLPAPATGGGQLVFVVHGQMRLDAGTAGERALAERAALTVQPHEPPPALRAGAAGAHLLFLQYPRPRAIDDKETS